MIQSYNYPIGSNYDNRIGFSYKNNPEVVSIFNSDKDELVVYRIKSLQNLEKYVAGKCSYENDFDIDSLPSVKNDELTKLLRKIADPIAKKIATSIDEYILGCISQKPIEEVEEIFNNEGVPLLWAKADQSTVYKKCSLLSSDFDPYKCATQLPVGDILYLAPQNDEL